MFKRAKDAKAGAFTLIELLVVIAIRLPTMTPEFADCIRFGAGPLAPTLRPATFTRVQTLLKWVVSPSRGIVFPRRNRRRRICPRDKKCPGRSP